MLFDMDGVFKLLNFCLLSIGVVYVMYRYGIGAIIAAIRIEKQKKDEMVIVHQDALKESSDIMMTVQEQERLFVDMQKKFTLWQQKLKEDAIVEHNKINLQQEIVQKKYTIKLQNWQCHQILRKQLPKFLHEVSNDLRVEFEKNRKQKQKYIADLLTLVKEKGV